MLKNLLNQIPNYFEPKALVVLYHRVAEVELDPWNLAVSPARFEQHLQVLKDFAPVISVPELLAKLHTKTLPRRSVVITFDDGYIDNFTYAMPLLEQFQLPATFFVVANTLTRSQDFWWDELARIFLVQPILPALFSLTIGNGQRLEFDLANDCVLSEDLWVLHQQWKGQYAPPPTRRAHLYHLLWQTLIPLPSAEQRAAISHIRDWTKATPPIQPNTMSVAQLQLLRDNPLFTVGAHTLTHPALAYHSSSVQKHELRMGKQLLSQELSSNIELVAYPYGSCNDETINLARAEEFTAAFTTQAQTITSNANPYRLGRFQVDNWDGPTLKKYIRHWFTYC
ncbi:polysaccharide deacetylase family protein [Hymenobacter arizonensis]|uniref:Polysaccharide deacetylase n=1 Tax=Hymenobacter arizonensis TaxID=1227077 RepID=A0A1I6BRT2_HYMAR|nr:polysaccharide deacetylase family protein [Hymenobacter arizonensis]SFQ83641.1 Polysaccharide deacetylase [Hymenobacter arizonensis]